MKRWYVVHTHANAEQKARSHLVRQGFEVYLPMYSRRISHARMVTWSPRPLFQRYLFVELDTGVDSWRKIHSTVGVQYMICQDERPVAIPEGIIDEIRSTEDSAGRISPGKRIALNCGDVVQITSGAMADQVGLFESRTADERVVILLNLLGREVRTTVSLDTIEVRS